MDGVLVSPYATPEELEELATEAIYPLRFTDAMDTAMYEEMIIAHRKGLRVEPAGFKHAAWTRILAAVQAQVTTGQRVSKKHCEWREEIQRNEWTEWKRLGTLSGWAYDPITELFVASDEQWQREIKFYPQAAGLRYSPCKYVKEFDELLHGRVATGRYALTIAELLPGLDRCGGLRLDTGHKGIRR